MSLKTERFINRVEDSYDPTVITRLRASHIQSISILFDQKDSYRFLWLPDHLQSLAAEIILPAISL
jgi:hypothetical protein